MEPNTTKQKFTVYIQCMKLITREVEADSLSAAIKQAEEVADDVHKTAQYDEVEVGEVVALPREALFSLGESPSFKGITYGDTWNGWAVPLFPIESVREIAANFATDQELTQVFVDDDGAVLIEDYDRREAETLDGEKTYSRNWDIVEPTVIKGVKYYALGCHEWIWSEDEPTTERENVNG